LQEWYSITSTYLVMKRTTSAAELLLRIDRHTAIPLRLQIERELRGAVQSGRLPSRSPLPSTRALAADLGVSRGVVVEAYEQLLAEGYFTAQHGSATRVASRRTDADPVQGPEPTIATPRFDLRPGLPDLSLFPRRAWMLSMRRALAAAPNGAFDYPDARGVEPARIALTTYLNRARATVARPDRVMFCSGSAQGIGLVCRVLRERGVLAVAVEDPGHADQCTDIRAANLRIRRIPVDGGGLRVDQLARSDAGAVLVTPAHQYPSGAVLAPDRRAALLEWAERTRGVIIEDDYDAEYRYDREPIGALQGLAPGRIVYVGSASKVLSPALRLGWRVLPSDLAADVAHAKLQADRGSSAFEQLAFADFLNRGELDRHLRRTRPIYRRRRDALVAALQTRFRGIPIRGVAAGLHFMIELDADLDEEAVVAAAARRSVRVYGAAAYRADPCLGPPALIIGYGGLSESEMAESVRQLALAVAECSRRYSRHSGRAS
jgi:GntR family transcriptional regulator / MocR family aminotransferase